MAESNLPDNLVFHGNGGSYPPHGRITAENHGPAVVVATWIMVCLMGLAIIALFGTRPSFGRDSMTIFSACVGSVICLLLLLVYCSRSQMADLIWRPGAGAYTECPGSSGCQPGPRKTQEQIEPRRLRILQQGLFSLDQRKGHR